MTEETYEIRGGDLVLGILQLPDPCPVRVVVTQTDVYLYVGPRDWQWSRKSGKLVGSGTCYFEIPKGPIECALSRLPHKK